MTMPRMPGDQLLRALQAGRPGLPAIVTSGYSETGVEQLFAGCRVDAFLSKPFTLEALRQAIDRVEAAQ